MKRTVDFYAEKLIDKYKNLIYKNSLKLEHSIREDFIQESKYEIWKSAFNYQFQGKCLHYWIVVNLNWKLMEFLEKGDRTVKPKTNWIFVNKKEKKEKETLLKKYLESNLTEEEYDEFSLLEYRQKGDTSTKSLNEAAYLDSKEKVEKIQNVVDPVEPTYDSESLSKVVLSRLTRHLNIKELRILNYRYGLKDGVQRTLEDIAHKEGVSRERIRQILEDHILKKMRGAAIFYKVSI